MGARRKGLINFEICFGGKREGRNRDSGGRGKGRRTRGKSLQFGPQCAIVLAPSKFKEFANIGQFIWRLKFFTVFKKSILFLTTQLTSFFFLIYFVSVEKKSI